MNRSNWITAASIFTLSVAVLAIQASHNRQLSLELQKQQPAEESEVPQSDRPERSIPTITSPSDKSDAVERAISALRIIVVDRNNPMEKFLVEILNPIEGLDAEQLLAVADGLPDSVDGLPNPVRQLVIRLAAEQNLEGIAKDEALMAQMGMEKSLTILARFDPSMALDKIPDMSVFKPVIQGSCLKCHDGDEPKGRFCPGKNSSKPFGDIQRSTEDAAKILGVDAKAGLLAYLKIKETDFTGQGEPTMLALLTSGSAPIRDEQIPELTDSLSDSQFEKIRPEIIRMILNQALFDEGVSEVAKRAEGLPITPEELEEYMLNVVGNGIGDPSYKSLDTLFSEPEATMEWVASAGTKEMVVDTFYNWVRADSEASIRWLDRQPASPTRDSMIRKLVNFPNLDPESGLAWASRIQDGQGRTNLENKFVESLKETDPKTAEAWLEKNRPTE